MQRFLSTTLERAGSVFGAESAAKKDAEESVVLGEVYAESYKSAKSLMARALTVHHLGRSWRVGEGGDAELGRLQYSQEYCDLISNFLDYPGSSHLYGLPNVASVGLRYGKLPGEWFGPQSISLVMRDLASVHFQKHNGGIQVFLPQGNVVNVDEVEALCCAQNFNPGANETLNLNFDPLLHVPPDSSVREWKSALVLLLPLRLGSIRISDDCADELREFLKTDECLGFIGGLPNHALYIIGLHRSSLLCIDPHTTEQHPSLCAPFPSESLRNSLHCDRVRLVDASSLDPSITIGFYFPCRASFLDWSRSRQARSPKSKLFTVQDFASAESVDLAASHAEDQDEDDDDEDYVIV